MRAAVLAGLLIIVPAYAHADASVSGQWRTDVEHGVLISMDVLADGHWFSQTIQDDKVVAEMAGTYEQTKTNDASGKIVFTPLKSQTSAEHGAAKVENDLYSLTDGGKVLSLTTPDKERMVFHNFTKDVQSK